MLDIENNKQNTRMSDFYKHFNKNVLPLLERYDSVRLEDLKKMIIYSFLAIPVTIIAICIISMRGGINIFESTDTLINSVPIFILCCAIAILMIICGVNYEYRKKVKKQFTQKIINSLGEIEWHSEKSLISDSEIRKSNLFGLYNDKTCDDSFKGIYKEVPFRISEVEMVDEVRTKRFYAAWKSFKGIIIAIKSNKKIKAQTIVTTKGDLNVQNIRFVYLIAALVVSIPILFFCDNIVMSSVIAGVLLLLGAIFCIIDTIKQKDKKQKSLKKILLEDLEFNKKYNTYSADEVEGRYLVTTAYMQRFKNLHTAFGIRNAKCSFFDDEIIFALSTSKNFFELSGNIFISLKDTKQIKKFYEEISAIYDIIDYFKLSEKTGL